MNPPNPCHNFPVNFIPYVWDTTHKKGREALRHVIVRASQKCLHPQQCNAQKFQLKKKNKEKSTARFPRCSLPSLEIVERLRLMWWGILATVALTPRLGARQVNTGQNQEVCHPSFLQIKKEIVFSCSLGSRGAKRLKYLHLYKPYGNIIRVQLSVMRVA